MIARIAVLFTLLPLNQAAAQACTPSTNDWLETGTASFSILYPANNPALGESIASQFGTALDREYLNFTSLFGASLDLPITIRVYPSQQDYYCLNTLAPEVNFRAAHGHIGSKEIAIFTDAIEAQPDLWRAEGINAFRYELGTLFVEKLSGGKAPPGLVIGVGLYLQDPTVMWPQNGGNAFSEGQPPPQTWRSLWENADPVRRSELMIPIGSITAYLIDVYGWNLLADFIKSLPTAEGYRQALFETYNIEMGALDDHWEVYYPAYIGGRWRANDIYGYDLMVFEQLIEAGAYTDANEGLEEAVAFLHQRGDEETALEAEQLKAVALAGVEGIAFARQTRQALVEADYPAVLAFAAEARARFVQVDQPAFLTEITNYESIAQEILDLRAELDGIESDINASNAESHQSRLIEIGTRFGGLGDEEGRDRTQLTLDRIVSLRENSITLGLTIVALVSAALIIWRIALVRRPPPPEAMLKI